MKTDSQKTNCHTQILAVLQHNMISPESIQTLKHSIDIIEHARKVMELQRVGPSLYSGNFNFPRSGSRKVLLSRELQRFKLDGEENYADVLSFEMRTRNLTFYQAMQELSREYRFSFSYSRSPSFASSKRKTFKSKIQNYLNEKRR